MVIFTTSPVGGNIVTGCFFGVYCKDDLWHKDCYALCQKKGCTYAEISTDRKKRNPV